MWCGETNTSMLFATCRKHVVVVEVMEEKQVVIKFLILAPIQRLALRLISMLCDSMAWLKALRSREGYVQTASSICRLWTIILMELLFVLDMKLMITEVLELRH